ncbi:MAG: glycosyltransferase [Bacteroidetes bacterium]|nr:glycosyltransferase [Bacteroidota bacterium]
MATISVVLPFRNAEATLNAAIESVQNQLFKDFECILVDNASTDNSKEVAQGFLDDQRFKLISEKKIGVWHAMNTALASANSRYLARMDADDLWFENKLEEQMSFLLMHQEVDVLGTQVEFKTDLPNADGFAEYVNWSNSLTTAGEINNSIFMESPIVNPSLVFRKELIEQHGNYIDNGWPEDYEMLLRWHSKGVKMQKVNEPLMTWKDSSQRLSRSHENFSKHAFNAVKCHYLAKWLEKNNPYHPAIWVWGSSRIMRRNAEELLNYGVVIEGYIDLKPGEIEGKPITSYIQVPADFDRFIVSFVGMRDQRLKVRQFLLNLGKVEGKQFVMAS